MDNPLVAETKTAGWTDAELRACVAAYRDMQLAESRGQRVNKTAKRNEALAGPLSDRSAPSYEFRMSNISAVLDGLGLPLLSGYQPRRNVGPAVTAKLIAIINDIWGREQTLEAPTSDPESLAVRVRSAKTKIVRGIQGTPPTNARSGVKVTGTSQRFVRDPNVIAWVLFKAEGRCEACDTPAPFLREDGEPYLEVHHVRPLGEGGPDSVDNTIAVCPSCHRRFHHGADRARFRRATLRAISRLVDYPELQTAILALSDAAEDRH
ncbi:HNH endonuclease [Rhizobium sp. 21-4511-3d]